MAVCPWRRVEWLVAPAERQLPNSNAVEIEVSIVMPCLNERDTLERCIVKAQRALTEHGISGEIIVADNGSSDGSPAIAEAAGARVVRVARRGYGSALMGGIVEARGRFVIMGDADDSYDFSEIPSFIAELRKGADLVQGCRMEKGGGKIMPGAMPYLHRHVGNPFFSVLARWWFRAPIHDVYCGLRGFTRRLYDRLDLRCTGMEFATEMIIKGSRFGARITEVPITLHPDGRVAHPPHLRTFRDGWRTLRFFLLFSPRWLFLVPGAALIGLGLLGYLVSLPGSSLFGVTLEGHTLLVSSLWIICGYQSILFGLFTKTFATGVGLMPADARLAWFLGRAPLEAGLVVGVLMVLLGLGLILVAVAEWWSTGFGNLEYARTMRWVIPGVTATTLGFMTCLSAFFLGILQLNRR
jgi:glycosyltransferase involved in cell wall biosynthesis